MSLRLDGKVASLSIKQQLKEEFLKLDKKACLAIIHYPDGANASYLKGRMKIAEELNVEIKVYEINENDTTSSLLQVIETFNNNKDIHRIMVDRPLPRKFDESSILASISIEKDVDGYGYSNLGKLLSNQNCFVSATPQAAVRLVDFYNIDLTGKDVLVIGRSINVGKPLSLLLLNKNATVTIAHSKTVDLKQKCKKADVIFLALGKANFLSKNDVNENTIIVDIGINYDENGKLCGDASKECYDIVKAYSPVPGGVGVLTNVCLMENVLKAAKNSK